MQAEPGGQPVPDAPDDAAEHELSFDQYLSAKGVLWIPAGFVPESVTVQVLEGGAVKTAYRVELEAVAAP